MENNFGMWLRSRRRLLDLTQQEFADQVGCARITMRRIESGTLKPSRKLALILLEKLGIPEIEWPQWILFARGLSPMPTGLGGLPAEKPFTNLPTFLNTFVGREKEQAEIIGLINKHRIVTLTGPGGIGKTRLSAQVAGQLLTGYKNGVWFVEFASLNDSEFLPQSVAAVLGLATQSNISPTETLINFLRAKTALLIFDNCEHLVGAAARLAEALLRACANVRILAASREALGLPGETVYRVPALSIPHSRLPASAESITRSESARLFIDRAQAALPAFVVTNENAPAVAQVCSRLDGIPLAIELAAARARVLKVEEIAGRLDDRFRLLIGGSRAAPPRQQTLRATIDWSYDLLSPPERSLLGRLSVFAGGCTLEAAEAVCADKDESKKAEAEIRPLEVLDLLTQLLDKSLVIADVSDGRAGAETRYRMLETIRQYAHEKLSEAGEAPQVGDRHLEYFLGLAERAEPELIGPHMAKWLRRLEAEMDNLRAALAWSLERDAQVGLRLASVLIWFWEESGRAGDGHNWLAQLIKQPEAQAHSIPRARGLGVLGYLLMSDGHWDDYYYKAPPILEESVALCRELGDESGIAFSLLSLGLSTHSKDYEQSWRLVAESLALYRKLGDPIGIARALMYLGGCVGTEDTDAARAYLEEGLAIFREKQYPVGIVHTLMHLGELARDRGDYAAARSWLEDGLAVQRQLGKSGNSFHILVDLGDLAFREGDYAQARAFAEESLFRTEQAGWMNYWAWVRLAYIDLRQGDAAAARKRFDECLLSFKEIGNPIGVAYTLEGLASLAVQQEQLARAARFFAWADATRTILGNPRPSIEQADIARDLAAIQAQLDEAALAAAQTEGRTMTMDQIIAYALESRAW